MSGQLVIFVFESASWPRTGNLYWFLHKDCSAHRKKQNKTKPKNIQSKKKKSRKYLRITVLNGTCLIAGQIIISQNCLRYFPTADSSTDSAFLRLRKVMNYCCTLRSSEQVIGMNGTTHETYTDASKLFICAHKICTCLFKTAFSLFILHFSTSSKLTSNSSGLS